MAILGTLLKKGIRLREMMEQEYTSPFDLQKKELKELLIAANQTEFGKHYNFAEILKDFRKGNKSFYDNFRNKIPIHTYNKIYGDWWKLSLKGVKNICWPGRVKYFALSSGTSEASSKHIPVTKDMTKAIQRTSIRQILSLSKYDLPSDFFTSGILMLGGSTHLNKIGNYFEGDLSGIQAAKLPFWFQHFYKPGKRIAKTRNWDAKLDEITKKAKDWDIGIIVGVPAWLQILMEKILDHYKVANIHEIWPNLKVYVHGGVSLDPYRKGFEKLMGKPIYYIETYLASEGFIAYQAYPNRRSMRLVLNNGMFYEFVPFEDKNFDENGEVKSEAQTLMIDEVEEGKEYAILLSSCAGAWRYLIGDVIKFVSLEESEIIITGRTKHFLSLCGEHLSVDNMNKAIELASNDLNIEVPEFAVAGIPHGTLFAHHWFVGTDNAVDGNVLREKIDGHLKVLNDDYAVERSAALKDVYVDVLPVHMFYDWMKSKGKVGGQNKFPRVMKNHQLEDWKAFIESHVNGNRS
ncbi:MAG: GH3 auxin-responsive promoter family protein [Cyclobacteriaceae bacterium]|nr:GH3 auxin-responsive promoter family protein [Cyclobacteriaceae bacterium]MBX2957364.1 GH3 auxin-responsive promoter family protein [Cyclobacteriaceae bacterium]